MVKVDRGCIMNTLPECDLCVFSGIDGGFRSKCFCDIRVSFHH